MKNWNPERKEQLEKMMMSLWDIASPNAIDVQQTDTSTICQTLISDIFRYRVALTETIRIYAGLFMRDLGKIDGADVTVNDYLDLISTDFLNRVIETKAGYILEHLKGDKDTYKTVKAVIEVITCKGGAFKLNDANAIIREAKAQYRTRAKAGEDILPLQANLATITLPGMEYSVSLLPQGDAYLEPIKNFVADKLQFDNGTLYFENDNGLKEEFTEAHLRIGTTNGEGIDKINLPLLRVYYTAILKRFEEKLKEMQRKGEYDWEELTNHLLVMPATFYVPDLIERIVAGRNFGKKQLDKLIDETVSFRHIIGVIYDYGHRASYFPVLSFMGYDAKKNPITFASPYLGYLIRSVYERSIKHGKNGTILRTKRGAPSLNPSHSYLIKSSIVSERNKDAITNVSNIVTLIEQAGGKGAHISAAELINRNPSFKERLQKSTNKVQLLSRTFKKTWELLRTQTRLEEAYRDITLPSPDDPCSIPVPSNLETKVFSFAHKGKIKSKTKDEDK